MPRVTLAEQSTYGFSHSITVETEDINQAGHLGNAALVARLQEARLEFFKHCGISTVSGQAGSIGLVIGDLALNFRSEGFAGDLLSIDIHADEIGWKAFRLFYRVRRGAQVIALAETGMVAFSKIEKKAVELPPEMVDCLTRFRNQASGLVDTP